MAEYVKAGVRENAVRCYTQALKNARHLQELAPETFALDRSADGFGTGGRDNSSLVLRVQ